MQVPLLDLKVQYATIKDEVMGAISEVCDSHAFALGPAVAEFEEKIAAYCNSKHAIGVSSGTDALIVSLMALGIKPGDEVITTPFTFFATAGSIVRLGAKPVFVDVDPDSYNIEASGIEQKITEKTRAIVPVHLFGQVAQMKAIKEIARRHNLAVIEDAAQAIGASQEGIKCGNFGDCGCFSFYPAKNLGGFGDGGLVTTNTEDLAQKIRTLRDHGQNPRYFYKMIGGNFRLDGIQGAVLTVKLKYLDGWNEKRRHNAVLYDSLFADSPVKPPKLYANNISIYHQYTVTVPERDKLQKFLAENNIGSAIFYPKPLHLQECFSDLGYRPGDFPIAERLCNEVLSLPIYPELVQDQVEYVAKTVLKFYGIN
ncbi:MAG TPA: DegT/DnrJ/EryC1/StrS family aminotransferase [Sedimentisphaerales bacterium]|nr:DegT/DnrJ/EryC1/StrS family aminotransferase [Sedimentisphaerales bacterium]